MTTSSSTYGRLAVLALFAVLVTTVFGMMYVFQYQYRTVQTLSDQTFALTQEVAIMREEMTRLSTENASFKDSDRHIAVSIKENKLYLMEGMDPIRVMPVATGSGRIVHQFGRRYEFTTPPGVYNVTLKETDPVWIAPDWHWHEKGETVPEKLTIKDRSFKGVLGKYRLNLRDGYAIHGTDQPNSIGRNITHGCVRVGAKDLEYLFHAVKQGTKVYIY